MTSRARRYLDVDALGDATLVVDCADRHGQRRSHREPPREREHPIPLGERQFVPVGLVHDVDLDLGVVELNFPRR